MFIEAARSVGKENLDLAFEDLCDTLDPQEARTFEQFTKTIKNTDPEFCNYYQVAICASGGDDVEFNRILKEAHKNFKDLHPC